jgi:hypothetical protein
VVAIGASTTYGLSADPPDSSWVNRLRVYLRETGFTDTVFNIAVPGIDCYQAMPDGYQPPENRPYPLDGKNISQALRLLEYVDNPDQGIVVVNYASNNYHLYSTSEILFCLQTIYNEAVTNGHRCFISTTQPRHDSPFSTAEARKKLAIIKDSIINRFGEANTLNFYDGLYKPSDTTILDKYSAGDRIHFNNAGHEELFRRVRDKLAPITAVETAEKRIRLFPNPVDDQLIIDVNGNHPQGRMVIMDMVGRRFWEGNIDTHLIDVRSFPAGMYLVRLHMGESSTITRIVKR